MKWAVVLVGDDDKERLTVFNSDQCYFSMSVCVRWHSHDLTAAGIKRLRFYAARPVFYDANDRPLSNRFTSIVHKYKGGICMTCVQSLHFLGLAG